MEEKMMSYELDMPGRAIVGADSRLRVGEESVGLGWSRVLLVTDGFHVKLVLSVKF